MFVQMPDVVADELLREVEPEWADRLVRIHPGRRVRKRHGADVRHHGGAQVAREPPVFLLKLCGCGGWIWRVHETIVLRRSQAWANAENPRLGAVGSVAL